MTNPDIPTRFRPSTRLASAGLLLLCLFTFFFRLGGISLFDLDEALYVSCARQMLATGDYVTPRLNSRPPANPQNLTVPFYEKPILVYWAASGAMRAFGQSETAARLPAALAALLTVGLIVGIGYRWFGTRAGLLAGMIYATAPMPLVDARQMTTDGLLVLWFAATMGAVTLLCRIGLPRRAEPEAPVRCWGGAFLLWTFCALAALTKGVIGLLLPTLVLSAFLVLNRRASATGLSLPATFWKTFLRLKPLPGLLLFLALAAPWHLLVARTGERDAQGRTFVQEYAIRQHIGRFKGGDTVHNAPPPTYFAYFLIGFFPWACFAPAAFRLGTPRRSEQTGDENEASVARDAEAHRFLLAWFWAIFLFFSLGAAKLPTYIAPAFPAAALLTGRWLDRLEWGQGARSLVRGGLGALVTAGLLAAAAVFGPHFAPANAPIPPDIARLALHLTLLLFGGCAVALACFLVGKSRGQTAGILAYALTMLGVVGIGVTEGYALAERDVLGTYQRLAAKANPTAQAGTPIVYYNIVPRRPSMLFYANYSPYELPAERRDSPPPLLPELRPLLAQSGQVCVLSSRRTWETLRQNEFAAAPDLTIEVQAEQGDGRNGWVLLRVRAR